MAKDKKPNSEAGEGFNPGEVFAQIARDYEAQKAEALKQLQGYFKSINEKLNSIGLGSIGKISIDELKTYDEHAVILAARGKPDVELCILEPRCEQTRDIKFSISTPAATGEPSRILHISRSSQEVARIVSLLIYNKMTPEQKSVLHQSYDQEHPPSFTPRAER
jgi:hypothetical protein